MKSYNKIRGPHDAIVGCVTIHSALLIEHRLVTDGQTDRQTDTVPQRTGVASRRKKHCW